VESSSVARLLPSDVVHGSSFATRWGLGMDARFVRAMAGQGFSSCEKSDRFSTEMRKSLGLEPGSKVSTLRYSENRSEGDRGSRGTGTCGALLSWLRKIN